MSDNKRFIEVYNDLNKFPTLTDVAKELGLAYKTVKNKAAELRKKHLSDPAYPTLVRRSLQKAGTIASTAEVEIEEIPDPEEPIEEIIDRAIRYNEKQHSVYERRKLVDVNLPTAGSFMVVGLPDQHLNNPGTLLRKAFDDAHLIAREEGVYCIAVGDWLDNFIIGRLERERRGDKMSHSDGTRLQEHYVELIAPKLLAAIGGNHNDWVGSLGGYDVLGALMSRLYRQNVYDADQVRVRLNTQDGGSFIHLVRHIFPGHSKYNTAHGVLSWMLDRWQGEDVLWGGHIHASAHIAIEREYMTESKVCHGIQLSTYKTLDGYADKRGFRKNNPFVAPAVIHTPSTGKTLFFEDLEEAARYLRYLRELEASK